MSIAGMQTGARRLAFIQKVHFAVQMNGFNILSGHILTNLCTH